ncbi:MAG: hypothetical protein ACRYFX_26320 [Janthinobacterium lividum]
MHTLLADALLAQQHRRATDHYERALAVLRQHWHPAPEHDGQHWLATLQPYAEVLQATRPAYLHTLAAEGLRYLQPQLQTQPANRDVLAAAAGLTLLAAQSAAPASRPAWHTQARGLLQRLRVAAGPEFRGALSYYPFAAQLAGLQAQQARTTSLATYQRYQAQAAAYRDSVKEQRVQARVSLGLARTWTGLRDFPAAVWELRHLLPILEATRDRYSLY